MCASMMRPEVPLAVTAMRRSLPANVVCIASDPLHCSAQTSVDLRGDHSFASPPRQQSFPSKRWLGKGFDEGRCRTQPRPPHTQVRDLYPKTRAPGRNARTTSGRVEEGPHKRRGRTQPRARTGSSSYEQPGGRTQHDSGRAQHDGDGCGYAGAQLKTAEPRGHPPGVC